MIVPPTIGIQVERPDFPQVGPFPFSGFVVHLPHFRSLQHVASAVAIFDLDRVLVRGGAGRVLASMARQSGAISREPSNGDVLYSLVDAFGDNLVVMAIARQLPLAFKGKQSTAVQFGASLIAPDLNEWLQEYAKEEIARHRAEGRKLMLVTAMPADAAKPIAAKLGFDITIATQFSVDESGKYDGGIAGSFVWSDGKKNAVIEYAAANDINLASSWAYSDSHNDQSLLEVVGNPVAVNPDHKLERAAQAANWAVVKFDDESGIESMIPSRGEAQRIAFKVLRPELLPFAKFEFSGLENLPADGPTIIAVKPNVTFDYVALALTLAQVGRTVGFVNSKDSWEDITAALEQGEVQVVFGGSFEAAARAAQDGARVHALIVHGSEEVWPKDKPLPAFWNLRNPPTVTVEVTPALELALTNASDDAAVIEAATA